jgi:glucose-6-phosphate-specific signal transduction histidine kinase
MNLFKDRRSALVVAGVLFAVVFALRMTLSDPGDGILFLSIVPIALLASEYRVAGGLVGATLAAVLLIAWIATMDVDLGVAGFATRLVTFFLVGVGVGLATGSRVDREARMRDLVEAEQRHIAALRIHDEVVQSLTVAKMALEMEDQPRALHALDDALTNARAVVASDVTPEGGSLRKVTTDHP